MINYPTIIQFIFLRIGVCVCVCIHLYISNNESKINTGELQPLLDFSAFNTLWCRCFGIVGLFSFVSSVSSVKCSGVLGLCAFSESHSRHHHQDTDLV